MEQGIGTGAKGASLVGLMWTSYAERLQASALSSVNDSSLWAAAHVSARASSHCEFLRISSCPCALCFCLLLV